VRLTQRKDEKRTRGRALSSCWTRMRWNILVVSGELATGESMEAISLKKPLQIVDWTRFSTRSAHMKMQASRTRRNRFVLEATRTG